jgi:mitochondrial import inner membrane translocase subunit TIM44
MRILNQSVATACSRPSALRTLVSRPSAYGRTAPYRRLSAHAPSLRPSPLDTVSKSSQLSSFHYSTPLLRSHISANSILLRSSPSLARHFHSSRWRLQQAAKSKEKAEEPVADKEAPPKAAAAEKAAEGEDAEAKAKTEGEQSEEPKTEGEESKTEGEESKTDGEESKKEGEEDGKGKGKAPPPPPHGDKTPWQVFTETLQSEFKASKEWNEGTKQLAAGYQDFTQNPTLQKAKSTYSQAAEAATTTTGAALKKTAGAIGSGAAWTWETPVVKVIRKGANAAGSGIEKVTRPVRETEAFKSVKETIDDGSSSRYGGWTEREERRKRREAREAQEMAKTGRKPAEGPAVEDPEYAPS